MAEPARIGQVRPLTRFIVRGGDTAVTAIGQAFGVELPRQACRAASDVYIFRVSYT